VTTTPQPPLAALTTTGRSTIKRQPDRGSDERAAAYAILDEGLIAHVGFSVDGQPFVIPMAYGRDGDRLILHGSVASRLMRTLSGGVPVCVTVTHLDALVLARSAFHHSMNYRSVVVFGEAQRVDDPDEIVDALDALVEHLVPGRAAEVRDSNRVELRQTVVLTLPIDDASVKSRTGGPNDDPEDLDLDVWAGVLPLATSTGTPLADAGSEERPVPATVAHWHRPGQSNS
jgi:nitroimidazol reductase NimA-like FMN-containing flavoprotein (pyridoxamine 5'-phosphate oxidase superfamily)